MSIEEKPLDLTLTYATKNLAQYLEIEEVKHPRLTYLREFRQDFGTMAFLKEFFSKVFLAPLDGTFMPSPDDIEAEPSEADRKINERNKKLKEGIIKAGIMSLEEKAALEIVERAGSNLGHLYKIFLLKENIPFSNPQPMSFSTQGDFLGELDYSMTSAIGRFSWEATDVGNYHFLLPDFRIKELDYDDIKAWVRAEVSERLGQGSEFELFSSVKVRLENGDSVSLYSENLYRTGFDEFLSDGDKPEKPNYGLLRSPTIADFE